ncbi:hypothetical protein ACA910_019633 [Epithemia clementina (nom. ined.)]
MWISFDCGDEEEFVNQLPQAIKKTKPQLHHASGQVESLAAINLREPVELVLFDEDAPKRQNEVWSLNTVIIVVWANGKGQTGPPKDDGCWATATLGIDHGAVGGVTNLRSWVSVAERKARRGITNPMMTSMLAQAPVGIRGATLKSVVDPTSPGPACPPSIDEWEDLQWRRLDRHELLARHKLPSVFASSKFVRRKLTSKELGSVFDFPMGIVKTIGGDATLKKWLDGTSIFPFKAQQEVIRRICEWSDRGYPSTCTRTGKLGVGRRRNLTTGRQRSQLTTLSPIRSRKEKEETRLKPM